MILYHGTNEDIKAIDLTRGMRHKDFGKGFYLTPDRNTAIRITVFLWNKTGFALSS